MSKIYTSTAITMKFLRALELFEGVFLAKFDPK